MLRIGLKVVVFHDVRLQALDDMIVDFSFHAALCTDQVVMLGGSSVFEL